MTETKRGMPARLFFRIDVDALTSAWEVTFSQQDVGIPQPRMRSSHNQEAPGAGSGVASTRKSHKQHPGAPTGKDVASPQANGKEAGTTAGTTSTNTGGGDPIDLEDLTAKLTIEFDKRGYGFKGALDRRIGETTRALRSVRTARPRVYCV